MSEASPDGVPQTEEVPKRGRVGRAMDDSRSHATGLRRRSGLSPRAFLLTLGLPVVCAALVIGTLVLAPAAERPLILGGTLIAAASGLAARSIGVYGGVLVPGLLLLGVDARFAAASASDDRAPSRSRSGQCRRRPSATWPSVAAAGRATAMCTAHRVGRW